MQITKSVLAYVRGSGHCVRPEKAGAQLAAVRLAVLLLAALAAWISPAATAAPLLDEPIQPVPLTLKQDPARADIGRQLFRDTRLSGNGRISCASCHDISKGGGDGRDRSVGLHGGLTSVNAPTVLNAALNFKQFWNGRAESLEAQADHVMQNPVEMGSKWEEVVQKVSQDPKYKAAFAASYKDGVTKANIQNAIATFERTLITPNSRFDKYLRGDANAISAAEKAGYAKFKQYGCVACHQGVNVGGNMFQKFGVMGDYFAKRGNPTEADLGRYLITKVESDKYVFKVPSLRNIALTAPYFHDASAKTLDEAVDIMFRYQLGRVASKEDKEAIIRFLNTLTGELDPKP
ncbi:cytochrome c peroxidase [Polaromonas sp. CF318]|uniref:cytochrome-c peroxidase n=1 Tax=Polaromonas sp. CF318 TaxID=1144318 RepID=UPI0002713558|nr:cytochrome-c peroxidase [Polaromonas sp. CF318]EJL85716.1 cytochrome c peroxidase [Polaromonas sp. CF318]